MIINNFKQTLLDLLFPPLCVHCNRVDAVFCGICQDDLAKTPLRVTNHLSATDHVLTDLATTGQHTDILQSAVHALKYQNVRSIAPLLATRMAQALHDFNWTFDIVIPVPLHINRERERGYNQAKELAVAVADLIRCDVADGLTRVQDTRSQVGLNHDERQHNIKDAFQAEETLIGGKSLLLIDDVLTTGATLNECAIAALNVGANAVYGLTVTAAYLN